MVEVLHGMVFTQQGFTRFQQFLSPAISRSLWGTDWMLNLAMSLRCGSVNFVHYTHHFSSNQGGSYTFDEAQAGMGIYLRQLGVPSTSLYDRDSPLVNFLVTKVTHYVRMMWLIELVSVAF